MSTLTFPDTHNMVAFLEKPAESNGFEEIIDFLNASSVQYALTVKTVSGERQLQALVDKKKVIITETSIRSNLNLEDAGGTDCLPTATIFEELARIGYEKPSPKLTFYKAFFSPQWKFLIHTITQCLSAKTTAWNEFSSTMASAIICLATNQKFNLSKYFLMLCTKKKKQKQKEANNAALAKEFDEIQARMDADHELAVRLTHEEQEKYTIEERVTLLSKYFERRKKQLVAERAEAIRNKPPTRA
ncbi:hypothetical protein Tco_1468389 [Tanacetum coccineum]